MDDILTSCYFKKITSPVETEYFQSMKSENIRLTELVYQAKSVENMDYLQFLQIWRNDKSCGNQYLQNICLTELGIPTKSVENITWNICNSLKSEKMTSLVETNTYSVRT